MAKSLKIYKFNGEKSEIRFTDEAPIELLEKQAEEIIKYSNDIQTIAIFDNNQLKGTRGKLPKEMLIKCHEVRVDQKPTTEVNSLEDFFNWRKKNPSIADGRISLGGYEISQWANDPRNKLTIEL